VESASIDFHMSKGDFANWLEYELNQPRMAEKVRELKEKKLSGEKLREELIKII